MENQVQALVCPNCGASTTNHHHCDYCGSILVRFAAQNITVDQTKYGKNAVTIPGLKEELKKNLLLQENNSTDIVYTKVFYKEKEICRITSPNISTGLTNYHYLPGHSEETPLVTKYETPDLESDFKKGLKIYFDFYHLTPGTTIDVEYFRTEQGWSIDQINALKNGLVEETMEEELFLQSSFATLANMEKLDDDYCGIVLGYSEQLERDLWTNDPGYFNHYTIDFDNDYEGASNIITQYLSEVKGLNNSEIISFKTEIFSPKLEELEKKEQTEAFEAAQEAAQKEERSNTIWYYIVGILLFLSFILFSLTN